MADPAEFAQTPPTQRNAYGPNLAPPDAEQRAATADPTGGAAQQRAWRKESYEFDDQSGRGQK